MLTGTGYGLGFFVKNCRPTISRKLIFLSIYHFPRPRIANGSGY
jgi:hypothetical protein